MSLFLYGLTYSTWHVFQRSGYSSELYVSNLSVTLTIHVPGTAL